MKKATRRCLIILGLISFIIINGAKASIDIFDSLRLKLKSAHACERAEILNEFAYQYRNTDPEESRKYAQRAVEEAGESGCGLIHVAATRNIGISYKNEGRYGLAEEMYDRALELALDLGDASVLSDIFNSKALLSWLQGDLEGALKAHFEALKIRESISDSTKISITYNNIGLVYFDLEEFEKSINFFEKSLKFNPPNLDGPWNGDPFNNLGMSYSQLGKLGEAEIYYGKALKNHIEFNNLLGQAQVYNNTAILKTRKGEFDLALDLQDESLMLAKTLGNRYLIADGYANKGDVYLKKRDYANALYYLQIAKGKADSLKMFPVKKAVLQNLIDLSILQKRSEQTILLQQQLIELNETINTKVKSEQLEILKKRFEAEKKDQEIGHLKKENAKQELIIEQQLLNLMLILSLVAITGFVVYFFNKVQRRNKEIKASLIQQELLLKAGIESQENERRRISKDLHDGVGQVLVALKLSWENIFASTDLNEQNREQVKQSSKWLKQASEEVRNISHQMLPRALAETGLVTAIRDLLERCFSNSKITFEFDAHNSDDRYDENFEINIYRIVQEVIANVIKHSEAKKVDVQILKNNDYIILNIGDDGIGMEQIYGHGNGINNIRSRVFLLKGSVNLDSTKGIGTTYTIRVPL